MTILIKGANMPQEGAVLVIDSRGEVWVNACPTRGYIRVDKAKAIPVPTPHGRLIDADALYELLDGGYDLNFDEVPETKRELLRMITDAPTVIEAEEGE